MCAVMLRCQSCSAAVLCACSACHLLHCASCHAVQMLQCFTHLPQVAHLLEWHGPLLNAAVGAHNLKGVGMAVAALTIKIQKPYMQSCYALHWTLAETMGRIYCCCDVLLQVL